MEYARENYGTMKRADLIAPALQFAEDGFALEQGDIETALNAASQIGDDTLQRRSQGTVVPDTFTHGTSAQRVNWFKRGFQSGSVDQCNTFDARQL